MCRFLEGPLKNWGLNLTVGFVGIRTSTRLDVFVFWLCLEKKVATALLWTLLPLNTYVYAHLRRRNAHPVTQPPILDMQHTSVIHSSTVFSLLSTAFLEKPPLLALEVVCEHYSPTLLLKYYYYHYHHHKRCPSRR